MVELAQLCNDVIHSKFLKLDPTELDYLVSVLTSILEDHQRLACTKALMTELHHEICDVVSSVITEQGVADPDALAEEIAFDVLGIVFPAVKSLLVPSESSMTRTEPLLEFLDLSLAYMGLELLRHTSFTVYRGKIYGIVGKNGIGKTTLLNKLANGEVPGFPKSVKSRMVRHELLEEFQLLTPKEIIKQESILKAVGFAGKDVHLASVPCSNLSGGWRMRVSIAYTISSNHDLDLLIMDEPTNHLDRECVTWLISFLKGWKEVCVVMVSHDEDFLDRTVDCLVYFNNHKLKMIESNFSDFVKSEKLDPATLLPLSEDPTAVTTIVHPFVLPKPGSLDGVKSMTQTIAKLEGVSFSFPQRADGRVAGVSNISGRVSLSSRIAMVGPNGAGKTTIAGLLVGELTPQVGEVYRHPNLRVAFVSQHHVHHLEAFLSKSCLDYIVHRFGTGLDREVMSLESLTESGYEQLDRMAKAKTFASKCNGRSVPGGVEALVGRRKDGKEYAYEVQWVSQPADKTDWIPRSVLETELGIGKLCVAYDTAVAQRKAGTDQRQLDFKSIKSYLKNYGILEHTAEGKISGLSGGQKSRLTLAAAMWTYPHLLVLDEPTNYLDSASLDALLDALSTFQGAVLVISHNSGFVEKFAREKWLVDNGQITISS